MELYVGTGSLRGDIRGYAKHFDLLEVRVQPAMPRPPRLEQMADAVREAFVFSVVLPLTSAALEAPAELVAQVKDAVGALGAKWLVVRTEADVRPSARTKTRLAELVRALPEAPHVAWEPRGLWEAEAADAFADELGVSLVRDVSREAPPAGDALYTRLRALGRTGVSLEAVETVAEVAVDYELACVVIEGSGAVKSAQLLRELTGQGSGAFDEAESVS